MSQAENARIGTASGIGGSLARYQQFSLFAAVLATWLFWPVVRNQIAPESQFALADLVKEHWAHRGELQPWLDQRWAWLAVHGYHLWLVLAVLPGVTSVGIVLGLAGRSILPLLVAPAGWVAGCALGYLLYIDLRTVSWPFAVMMPATFSFLGGAIMARLAVPSHKERVIRGTRIRKLSFLPIKRLFARLRNQVILAGVPISREDEMMHVAAIGTTGSGKSTALLGLMKDALRRGDRHVVADPEGTAMHAFFQQGDIILNPFDPHSAKWDVLSEIERQSDFAFVAQSLLPRFGSGDQVQWVSYAQQLLTGVMENFVRLGLGGSDDLVMILASAKTKELKALCAGTPASRFFEEGGERMLASILGTLAPAIACLRSARSSPGEAFSVRQWVRSGCGSLWLPYAANEIAALRSLVSCWMNLAIFETLSLTPSRNRRIWFHIDELEALGRIEGLSDGLARLRKFGGRVAIGFQSFSQVKQIYGESAHTIIENCGNLLLLRAGGSAGGGTAKLASDLVGSREIARYERSQSSSKAITRSKSMQPSRTTELAALASELMLLKSHQGYLKRATAHYWVQLPKQRRFVAILPR